MKSMNDQVSEWLLGVAILGALTLLINPFGLLMTSAYVLTLIMALALVVIIFGVFIWRERPRDEREALHGLQAGRISYFVGGAVLVIAIIVQALDHALDIWLPVALGAMVLTKLVTGAWMRQK